MNKIHQISSALLASAVLFSVPSFAASDCPNTQWQPSNGRTCARLGLNSKKPVCKGEQFAIACDDTRTQIRTCRTNLVCSAQGVQRSYSWDNSVPGGVSSWVMPGWQGNVQQNNSNYMNYRGKRFHCTEWNYDKARPCKSGRINEDCQGSC